MAKTREEQTAYMNQWRRQDKINNPEKYKNGLGVNAPSNTLQYRRDQRIKNLYGITRIKYNEMYEECSGRCHICNEHQDVLCIDHCHTTNKVRGLLCKLCNAGLGYFQDNVEYLNSAIEYLQSNMDYRELPEKPSQKQD